MPLFPPLSGPRVLVVEDLESSRRVIASYLSLWNAGVEFTASVSQAAQLSREAAKEGELFDALIVSLPTADAAVTSILESVRRAQICLHCPGFYCRGLHGAWRHYRTATRIMPVWWRSRCAEPISMMPSCKSCPASPLLLQPPSPSDRWERCRQPGNCAEASL